ncbi:uncharacterized protein [Panulirus ornatus]|uniref:uncharacterized protein isoform X1 n=1 Tax=Panulirus ornatus TaxID=150431 RepID=UPI003A8998C2
MEEVELEVIDVDNFSLPVNLESVVTTTSSSADDDDNDVMTNTADDRVVVACGGDEQTSEGGTEIDKDVTVDDNGGGGERQHNMAIGSAAENDHQILSIAGDDGRSHTVVQSVDAKTTRHDRLSVEGRPPSPGDAGDYDEPGQGGGEGEEAATRAGPVQAIITNATDEDISSDVTGRTDDEDEDYYTDVETSDGSILESHMSADSEDEFDLVRTLRHYRRRRRRSSDSSSSESNCSCDSCISRTNWKFFDSEEGPPGGENTVYRRAALWMDGMKYMMSFLMYGLLLFSVVLTVTALWLLDFTVAVCKNKGACKVLYGAIPLTVVTVIAILAWHICQCILLRKGYGKGSQLLERQLIIQHAQSKGLVYSIRGAIYAPTKPAPMGSTHPPQYEVVAYNWEYSTSSYFDSDLEADGQYRRNITPWREVADPATRERRNIYTRKAWFRDVPIIWWEMSTQPPRNF